MKQLVTVLSAIGLFINPAYAGGEQISYEKVLPYTNVTSFAISSDEQTLIFTQKEEGQGGKAYQVNKTPNGNWGNVIALERINGKGTLNTDIGGMSLSYDGKTLYYHANYEDGVGGYDIYYSTLTEKGWSSPKLFESINTAQDEKSPTIEPGGKRIFFLRHIMNSDSRIEKKEATRMAIHFAEKTPQGKWKNAEPAHIVLNKGWVEDVSLGNDARTIYYSSRKERKEPALINYSYNSLDSWTLPEVIFDEENSLDYLSPKQAGENIYMIRTNNKKREGMGAIVSYTPRKRFLAKQCAKEESKVNTQNGKAVNAIINVYNPTTMKCIGSYETNENGEFKMTNYVNEAIEETNYFIDVRSDGYSYNRYFASYKTDNLKKAIESTINVFDTIELQIQVFDAEIYRPLSAKVIAVEQSERKTIYRAKKENEGIYTLRLALGHNYNVISTCNTFKENKFLFRLEGDIIFNKFERFLPMEPLKRGFTIAIVDAETKESLNGDITINNLAREEKINIKSHDMSNGRYAVELRDIDKYSISISGVKNYSFISKEVDMKLFRDSLMVVELMPIREGLAISLQNINFATGSAELSEESYTELNRLVKLIKENPNLKFEVSAHTDNIGNAQYNIRLSELRAASVSNYLIENGVPKKNIESKGYGFTRPKVANTSEENRAINRRVEFMLIADPKQ